MKTPENISQINNSFYKHSRNQNIKQYDNAENIKQYDNAETWDDFEQTFQYYQSLKSIKWKCSFS